MHRPAKAVAVAAAATTVFTGIAFQPAAAAPYSWACQEYPSRLPRNATIGGIIGTNCWTTSGDASQYFFFYHPSRTLPVYYCSEAYRENDYAPNAVVGNGCHHYDPSNPWNPPRPRPWPFP
ncbi:hypothetical protein [Nonomuraea sp. NPDC050202]|uniref:hypothetical protein n=1 Tax=Nonomuraea sp. NPDC050202 TaxID=3155035 RepID=UPI0033D86AE1